MKIMQILSNHRIKVVSLVFLVLFFLFFFWNRMFIYIYPGQAGILMHSLQADALGDDVFREGLYFIAPWNKMYIYDVTKQKTTVDVTAMTDNGLSVGLRVSAVFHPDPARLKELATHVGVDYTAKLLVPTIFSSVRKTIGDYAPEALYTTAKSVLRDRVFEDAKKELGEEPFLLEDIVIENLEFPKAVMQAIEYKLKRQQEALTYTYILAIERDEAARRKIEAESLQAYQEVVSRNLGPNILKWLEIKALSRLAESPNSKIVVLGGDGKSMPLVLDAKETEAARQIEKKAAQAEKKVEALKEAAAK